MRTLGPNFKRLVRAATAAMAVMGSGTKAGEDRRSENQTESIELFSHSSTKRQKKSAPPAGPLGQSPGITPMRYLICTRRLYHAVRLTGLGPSPKMNVGSFMRDQDKHHQIIEAAVRVFARNGYFNSRVSDIAREAGVASGTIYLYFKTKDAILVTLFREKMAAWVAHVRAEIAGEPDAVAKIRRLVALHFSVLENDPALAEVVQVELRQGHKFFRGASAHEVSAYFELIGSILEEGQAAGQIRRDVAIKIATKVLFGAMDQVATSWVLGKRKYRLSDATEAVAAVFLRGVSVDGV